MSRTLSEKTRAYMARGMTKEDAQRKIKSEREAANDRANPEARRKRWARYRERRRNRSAAPTCGFCHQAMAIQIVQSLIPTNDGFEPVNVPYCGNC